MAKMNASVLIVDDDPDIITAARVVLRQKLETVATESNPQRLRTLLTNSKFDVILLDMNFKAGMMSGNEGLFWLREILSINPKQKVVLITAYGDINQAVEAMKLGAADFVVKPWANEKLEAAVLSAASSTSSLQSGQSTTPDKFDFIVASPVMKKLMADISKVAGTDANVLLLGENGTGKEVVAKYIHSNSRRSVEPFLKVDLGSLSAGIFESELFGYKKGSFTDAKEDRSGRFEIANKGTLFLDEIGNLSMPQQTKILSVLQNREIVPLGSNTAVPVDIRLICATNADLSDAVSSGRFREDLLYRINTVEVVIPPLRQRIEDIPALANHFIALYSAKYYKEKKPLSDNVIGFLQRHSWPGNVRELQHAVERAVIMSDDEELQNKDFMFSVRKEQLEKKDDLNLDEMEKRAIRFAIQKHNGNMSKVAKELGLGRTTLYRKLERYGIDK